MATKQEKKERERLERAADELNDILFEENDPQCIDAKDDMSVLKRKILQASTLLEPGDDVSKQLQAVIDELKAESEEESAEEEQQTGEPTEEEKVAPPAEPSNEDLLAEVVATRKLGQLKEMVEEYAAFKGLRGQLNKYTGLEGPKQLKVAMRRALKADESEPATKSDKRTEKPKQSAPAERASKSVDGRLTKFTDAQKIKLLVRENPKKPGSAAHERFKHYFEADTVGDFLAAGGQRADLSWDTRKGFIEVE